MEYQEGGEVRADQAGEALESVASAVGRSAEVEWDVQAGSAGDCFQALKVIMAEDPEGAHTVPIRTALIPSAFAAIAIGPLKLADS